MNSITKTCKMASKDELTVSTSPFAKFTFKAVEGERISTIAMNSATDVLRVISSLRGYEGERTFKCSLTDSDKMDIESRPDFLIVRVRQNGEISTVFLSLEDAKDIVKFIEAEEGIADDNAPEERSDDVLDGIRKTCRLHNQDYLRVFTDGEDVGIYTNDGALVYLQGDDVLDVIVELIAYTNSADSFDGALELTRVKVLVSEERTPVVQVSVQEK